MTLQARSLTHFSTVRTAVFVNRFSIGSAKLSAFFIPAKIIFLIFTLFTSDQNPNPVCFCKRVKNCLFSVFLRAAKIRTLCYSAQIFSLFFCRFFQPAKELICIPSNRTTPRSKSGCKHTQSSDYQPNKSFRTPAKPL